MAGINISWDKIFARAVSTGVKKLGDIAETTDANIKAESKASAEAFAEANEQYTNEVQNNKKALSKEVDSISDLVGGDVGKIRTIMRTYGNSDVISQLQKDFQSYQANALRNTPGVSTTQDLKFKTLQEYINGKLTKTGTALVSDKAAEQATDEAAISGDELDIQQAEKKAKNMGVSLEQYLNTQARKLSSRPAFSIEGKAARLVEESKVGAFGKTLTMEEARKMVTGGQKLGGTEEETDLGDTGFALEREGGLSGEVIAKIMREKRELREETGEVYDSADLAAEENRIATLLSSKGLKTLVEKQGDKLILKDNDAAKEEALKIINEKLQPQPKGMPQLSLKSIAILKRLKAQIEGPKKKGVQEAIEELKKNPKLIGDFVKKFGKNKVPPELQKLIPKDDNTIKIKEKNIKERVIDSEGNAPPKPPSSFLTKPSEKKARDEWDKLYGDDYYPNGKPKPKKV